MCPASPEPELGAAGTGITRESLVLGVYGDEVDDLVTAASVLLDTLPPPPALRAWLERLLHLGRRTPEFADAMCLAASAPPGQRSHAYGLLLAPLSTLVSANESAGTIVPGTTADDVLLLLVPLWRAGCRDEDPARAPRLFDVLLRGLCPGSAQHASRPAVAPDGRAQ